MTKVATLGCKICGVRGRQVDLQDVWQTHNSLCSEKGATYGTSEESKPTGANRIGCKVLSPSGTGRKNTSARNWERLEKLGNL